MCGWIKTHRAIQDHWIFADAEKYRAWMIILFAVNFETKKQLIDGELIECKRGQALFSINSWALKFGDKWSVQKVKSFFKLLKKNGMIQTEGLRKTTRLTVCNYESYQNDQPANNLQTTSRQPAGNQQVTTTKEGKEIKKDKNNKVRAKTFVPPSLSEIKTYCLERGNTVDPERFSDHYKSNGWMIGKNKMKDWKATVRTWEKREKEISSGNSGIKANIINAGSFNANEDF